MHIDITELSNKAPFAVIQNVYTENELSEILLELDYLISRPGIWKNPSDSGSAIDHEGNKLKKNKAIFLNLLYSDTNASAILTNNMKFCSNDQVLTGLLQSHAWFEYVLHNSEYTTLLSYYEESDYYEAHRDKSVLTALTWVYKEPKSFEGGNLILNNEATIECTNNMTVLFPSVVLHEVTPVVMKSHASDRGMGRFTITNFIDTVK